MNYQIKSQKSNNMDIWLLLFEHVIFEHHNFKYLWYLLSALIHYSKYSNKLLKTFIVILKKILSIFFTIFYENIIGLLNSLSIKKHFIHNNNMLNNYLQSLQNSFQIFIIYSGRTNRCIKTLIGLILIICSADKIKHENIFHISSKFCILRDVVFACVVSILHTYDIVNFHSSVSIVKDQGIPSSCEFNALKNFKNALKISKKMQYKMAKIQYKINLRWFLI
ncbi:hypothetical protein AGLY_006473 [Aphis glycines]|uniref:Uncharacterized protein n=1 Tax=Aphis glycines TaxID=307491 RepID=A0A6G0TR49_APHGL|nr:hypothetical protein AGLY_006473 [Aphis glycines]